MDAFAAHESPAISAWLAELRRRCEASAPGRCRGVDWSAGARVARFDADGQRYSLRWANGRAPHPHRGSGESAAQALPAFTAVLRRLGEPPDGLFHEPPPRPLGRAVDIDALGEEGSILIPILERWAELVAPVGVHELDGGGWALAFPRLPEALDPGGRTRFQPLPGFLRASPHRAVWEALGFRADPDAVLRTVPTPNTLVRRAERYGLPLAFVPRLLPLDRDVVPRERWVKAVASGTVPVHVPGEGRLSRTADRVLAGVLRPLPLARSALASRLAALPHDLGKQVLVTRRVPAAYRARLLARIPNRAPASTWAAWTDFFEDELPRACEELYARCEEPEDFDTLAGELPPGPPV